MCDKQNFYELGAFLIDERSRADLTPTRARLLWYASALNLPYLKICCVIFQMNYIANRVYENAEHSQKLVFYH